MGTEAGTERGRGWRPVDKHMMETGAGTETRVVAEIGTGTRTGSGRVEVRRRSARNRTRIVDAIRHFHSSSVIISADRGWRLRGPDSPVRKARCLYTRIAPRE